MPARSGNPQIGADLAAGGVLGGIGRWDPQSFNFDYARVAASGMNVVTDNVGSCGYNNFNYTPEQTLRLIETFHRTAEPHHERMALALRAADVRKEDEFVIIGKAMARCASFV